MTKQRQLFFRAHVIKEAVEHYINLRYIIILDHRNITVLFFAESFFSAVSTLMLSSGYPIVFF